MVPVALPSDVEVVGVVMADAKYDVNVRFQWSHDLSAPLVLGRTENLSGRRILWLMMNRVCCDGIVQ